MPEDYFGERVAQTYEAKWPELFDPGAIDPAVGFLAELAGPGAALELGIGTGRIALPLSRRGVRVHGIDLSPAMVARRQRQPHLGLAAGPLRRAAAHRATTRHCGKWWYGALK